MMNDTRNNLTLIQAPHLCDGYELIINCDAVNVREKVEKKLLIGKMEFLNGNRETKWEHE
jgi:hypothetical protein